MDASGEQPEWSLLTRTHEARERSRARLSVNVWLAFGRQPWQIALLGRQPGSLSTRVSRTSLLIVIVPSSRTYSSLTCFLISLLLLILFSVPLLFFFFHSPPPLNQHQVQHQHYISLAFILCSFQSTFEARKDNEPRSVDTRVNRTRHTESRFSRDGRPRAKTNYISVQSDSEYHEFQIWEKKFISLLAIPGRHCEFFLS